MGAAARTLVLPFTSGSVPHPSGNQNWWFFNAENLPDAPFLKAHLTCFQSFRPLFNQLEQSGYQVTPAFAGSLATASGALILLGRFRRLNELYVALANQHLPAGSPIIFAGEKTSGVGSLRKWAAKHLTVTDAQSKTHCQVVTVESAPSPSLDLLAQQLPL